MKKVLQATAAVLLLLSLAGCMSRADKKRASAETETGIVAETTTPEHNASNSLDFEGVYESDSLPGPNGPMSISITLNGGEFTRKIIIPGEPGRIIRDSGIFTWNDAGNVITLFGAERPNQYFVAEGMLIQLDKQGERITGSHADRYNIPQISSGAAH